MGTTLRTFPRPSGATDGTKGGSESCRLVLGAVENFRFFDVNVYPLSDAEAAVAEFKANGLIKSTGRVYVQNYVLFLRTTDGKITFLREYFDPVRAAQALNTPILDLNS
jgi:uncharacterized protein